MVQTSQRWIKKQNKEKTTIGNGEGVNQGKLNRAPQRAETLLVLWNKRKKSHNSDSDSGSGYGRLPLLSALCALSH